MVPVTGDNTAQVLATVTLNGVGSTVMSVVNDGNPNLKALDQHVQSAKLAMQARIAKSVPRAMPGQIVPSARSGGNHGHTNRSCSPIQLRMMAAISATSADPIILGTTATVVHTATMYQW